MLQNQPKVSISSNNKQNMARNIWFHQTFESCITRSPYCRLTAPINLELWFFLALIKNETFLANNLERKVNIYHNLKRRRRVSQSKRLTTSTLKFISRSFFSLKWTSHEKI